jgi:hypothetical protein
MWAIELSEFELDFISSCTIHVLTDFVVEWTPVIGLKNEELTTEPRWDSYIDNRICTSMAP